MKVQFADQINPSLFDMPGVANVKSVDGVITMTVHENIDQVVKRAADHQIVNMNLRMYSLEEMFLRYYKDGKDATGFSQGIIFGQYILFTVTSLMEILEWLKYLTFQYYWDYNAMLYDHAFDITGFLVLTAATAVLIGLAVWVFEKQDILT